MAITNKQVDMMQHQDNTTAKLYVLNGATSTGKSSTAKELQNLLPDPNILLGIDHFHLAIPSLKLDLNNPDANYIKPEFFTNIQIH